MYSIQHIKKLFFAFSILGLFAACQSESVNNQAIIQNEGAFELAGCWGLEQQDSPEMLLQFRFEADKGTDYRGIYGGGDFEESFTRPYTFDLTHDSQKLVLFKVIRAEDPSKELSGEGFGEFLKGDIVNENLISVSFFVLSNLGTLPFEEKTHTLKRLSCDSIPTLETAAETGSDRLSKPEPSRPPITEVSPSPEVLASSLSKAQYIALFSCYAEKNPALAASTTQIIASLNAVPDASFPIFATQQGFLNTANQALLAGCSVEN